MADLRAALEQIAAVEEFRHGSGVVDYRPRLTADQMQKIAFAALHPADANHSPDDGKMIDRGPPSAQQSVADHLRLYDADSLMADGEVEMTAAEDVLAWLLIEKIGMPDDQGYTPNQAQQIIANALEAALAEGWVPLTCKGEQMTCRLPADETVVEVMLGDGAVCRSWFGSNIMEAGDWDFLPVGDDDEPDDQADSLGGRVVAWRHTAPSSPAPEADRNG